MKWPELHRWDVTATEARAIQATLAPRIVTRGGPRKVHFVAGVDVSGVDALGMAQAAVVVLEYPGMSVIEAVRVKDKVSFPYVPGLLSFREIPLLMQVFNRVRSVPDLIIADGQGLAHPRRLGMASHLGLILNIPTIGCAKSVLVGEHQMVGDAVGSCEQLIDRGEAIGTAVRTKTGSKPVYVSVGHKLSLSMAVAWVLRCCHGYRIPEPTRLAHKVAGGQAIDSLGY